jgi:hypothetical protein
MSKKKGTVTACGKGKFSYFIMLDTKDGYYFNTKYEPKCGKGDVVGIEFNDKDGKRGNVQKVTVLEQNSTGYEDTTKQRQSSGGGGGGADRTPSIVYQSSRKDALVFLGLLFEQGAFVIKGAAGKKEEQIALKLREITGEFYADAIDPAKSPALLDAEEEAAEDEADDFEEEEEEDFDDEWED